MNDNTELHFIITEDGRDDPPIEAQRMIQALAEACQPFVEAAMAAAEQAFAALREWLAPVIEEFARVVRAWWLFLPPYVRAWAIRRWRYAGRPVTGPPRRALFATRLSLLA